MIVGAARIKDLIRNKTCGDGAKSQMLLRHFAMERFLERLSVSSYCNDFIIKGGMLMSSLIGVDERMTRDIDTTMRKHSLTLKTMGKIMGEVAALDLGDGFSFVLGKAAEIMQDAKYGGIRIPIEAHIEKTKVPFKIDISTGDALTPSDIKYEYKLMFEDRFITLSSYNVETVLAEKLEAILSLSLQNTRMRDFYDVCMLVNVKDIDYALLKEALEATMRTRKSSMSVKNAQNVIDVLFGSSDMPNHWKRYQATNAYAENLSWEDALNSLWDVFQKMQLSN